MRPSLKPHRENRRKAGRKGGEEEGRKGERKGGGGKGRERKMLSPNVAP